MQGFSDTPDDYQGGEKSAWKARKVAYINHLKDAHVPVLRVAIADKLHNARELLSDLEIEGPSTIDRFNVGWDEQVWYLDELLAVFDDRMKGSIHLEVFQETVCEIRAVSEKAKTPCASLPKDYGTPEWYERVEDESFERMAKTLKPRKKI